MATDRLVTEAQRRQAVDDARHSIRLEGGVIDPESAALEERYVAGELTLAEFGEAIQALVARDLPARGD